MRRKLTIAMLLSLSAASLQALALGVGEVAVHSPLNAPLRATIPLTDTAGMESSLLRVSVAEPREFESAGLTRSPLAASVRAAVQVREGQLVVELFSERAVREPWLDLMLSFEWPEGRQLREVTLLLDPPDYDQLPVLVGVSRAQPASTAERSATETVREAPTQPVVTQSRDTQSGDPAWVSSGDTLWAVAGRLRPDSGISMDQMMVALVEANPDIFPSGNINAMRAGHTLVVPSRDAIAARSSQQAGAVVQAMNQAWASRGSGAPATVPLGTTEVASVDAVPADSTELVDTDGEPEAVSGAEGAAGGLVAGVEESAEPRLTLLSDAELAAEAASDPAQSAEAEADTRSQSEAGQVASTESQLDPEVLASLDAGGLVSQNEAQRLANLERRWLESQNALEAVQAERDALQNELGGLRSEVDAMRDQLATLVAGGQGVDGPGGGGMVPPGGEANGAESPWWGAVYQDSLDRQLMLGGAGLAALLGLWLLIRRRRYRESESTKGFATMPNVTYGAPAAPADVPPASQVTPPVVAGMSVTSSEPAVESPAPMPQAEAISEADIFMAYGRYDQARESLLAGLAREPDRDDLRLKLLAVHVEQGDWSAAEQEAERLAEGGDPSMVAEASRLMAARRAAAPDNDQGVGQPRSEFAAARELPPQEFDSLLDPQNRAAEKGGETGNGSAVEKGDGVEQISGLGGSENDWPRVGQPDDDHQFHAANEPTRFSEPMTSLENEEVEKAEEQEEETRKGESSPEQPSRRTTGLASDMIDYQPPTLDPEPGRREETPMQPSIDFPTTAPGKEAAGGAAGEPVDTPKNTARPNEALPTEEEWEVEEVAFPPLERDNDYASDTRAGSDDLEEARRLLEVGATERAHALLKRLLDSTADPGLQAQARELITHYRL
ncbi:FimV/HubP family polar landmark protein [Billgrantia montanilacus]|uniref:FimV N-terminal domain-containing protein n=1 Tax=Billgrantia montanilacus TaxID=2282305 RepID=A0A368U1K0_9GAMM|nr:FimV/HubP family polar landmark protein [Halomonas montanilacus]RCV90980.1 hypothetical protein DU505_03565 [Halomonas montanilacus]